MLNDVARLQPYLTALYSAGSELIIHGHLRAELYFRPSVFPLDLPPVRQSMEDILFGVNHFNKVAILQHLTNKKLQSCNVYCEFVESYSFVPILLFPSTMVSKHT
jgi:transcriptional regulator with GAF, ATPase, and Fis domain